MTRRLWASCGAAMVVAVLLGALPDAQELLTLTTPQTATATTCTVTYIGLNLTGASIVANVALNNGTSSTVTYDAAGVHVNGAQGTATPTGATLLHSLNVGNFSGATSLIHAVHNRLSTDNVCVGTVSGSPQH